MLTIIPENSNEYSIIMYFENIFTKKELNLLENWLINNNKLNNQNIGIKRKQIWFQRDGNYFCKDWINRFPRWESKNYDNVLDKLEIKIQKFINKTIDLNYPNVQIPKINSCLINKYSDNTDFIKPHRDTHLSFGLYPTIIGLSIGATRTLKLKRVLYKKDNIKLELDKTKQHLNKTIDLKHGSIFILAGSANKYFSHEIEKSDLHKKTRYSFTFREYIINDKQN